MEKRKNYDNIIITKDSPLVVGKATDTMHYGTVYLEEGAYIELRAGQKFTIEELQPLSCIANSENTTFAKYPTISRYEKIRDWTDYDIIVTTIPGTDGERGDKGGSGGGCGERGENGTNGTEELRTTFSLVINELGRNITVLSIGGEGGNGGNGGSGGNGWNGTSPSDPGTIGGNGGKGGNGGNASNAVKMLFVHWDSEDGYTLKTECKAAPGGIGGKGGSTGANGKYYDGADKPKEGLPGRNGCDGLSGKWTRIKLQKYKSIPSIGLFDHIALEQEFKGSMELDFSNTRHAKAFLNYYGGEEFLSAKYPKFYHAYLRTVQAAKEGSLEETSPDGTIPLNFGVTALDSGNPKMHGNDGLMTNKEALTLDVFNYTVIHDADPTNSFVTGEICIKEGDSETILESFALTSENELDYYFSTWPLDYVGLDGIMMQEKSTRTITNQDATLSAQIAKTEAILVNGLNDVVSNITINTPKSNKNNNPLIYLYDRSAASGENSDKDYSKDQVQYHDSDNTVNTLLGISGSITFNPDAGVTALCGYAMNTDTNNRKLFVSGKGAAEYNYKPEEMASFFHPAASPKNPSTNLTVQFQFPDDWRCRLSKNVYDNGAKSVIVDLVFSFYYKIRLKDPKTGKLQDFDMPITIKSLSSLPDQKQYYTSSNSTNVFIPPIKIRWGCFAADTLILMADGTEKMICEIKKDDMVSTPTGSKPVLELYYGTEKSLVCIEATNGKKLLVTKDHPVLSGRGAIRAMHLTSDDELLCSDNTPFNISAIYEIDYEEEQEVYNLEVEGGIVYANGFLAGEFETQNDLTKITESELFKEYGVIVPGMEKDEKLRVEAREVFEELKQLCNERFGVKL